MKKTETNDPLALLEQIQPVEAPPFLLTRILQKVGNDKRSALSPVRSWALVFALICLFVLNIMVILSAIQEPTKDASRQELTVAHEMDLLPQNMLYR